MSAGSPTAYPFMSCWVAPIRHTLTFLRSASHGRPAGSSYFRPGSWPYGGYALAPLNPMSVCLRSSPSSTGCICLVPPPMRKDDPDTPLFHGARYPRTVPSYHRSSGRAHLLEIPSGATQYPRVPRRSAADWALGGNPSFGEKHKRNTVVRLSPAYAIIDGIFLSETGNLLQPNRA